MHCKFLGGLLNRHYLLNTLRLIGRNSILASVSNKVLSNRNSYFTGKIELVLSKIIRQKIVVSGLLKFLNLLKQFEPRQSVIIFRILVRPKFRQSNRIANRL